MYYNTTHSMQDLAIWSDHKKSKETTLEHFIMLDGLKQKGQDSQCSHSEVKYVMDLKDWYLENVSRKRQKRKAD